MVQVFLLNELNEMNCLIFNFTNTNYDTFAFSGGGTGEDAL